MIKGREATSGASEGTVKTGRWKSKCTYRQCHSSHLQPTEEHRVLLRCVEMPPTNPPIHAACGRKLVGYRWKEAKLQIHRPPSSPSRGGPRLMRDLKDPKRPKEAPKQVFLECRVSYHDGVPNIKSRFGRRIWAQREKCKVN